MSKRREQGLVEQFVPQPAVEALDEGILDRLARGNVVPVDPHPVSEAQDGIGRELSPIAPTEGMSGGGRGSGARSFSLQVRSTRGGDDQSEFL